ncbi:histidine triad nucleotide-binding protein [Wohlfahrtiimonas larvae]|uniref:Histidine triad nucleotide-binding protein n=1 Tax=Wohlfahrtiimonas larvae TaxID=1157986 RepID=A0ABP9MI69_9GAMM|nr:histidine triad nucleotide-binding protein [Wohlfahrtiimonas larvae]
MSTIFTKIIQKEIPADIVYEDDEILAFRDISPQAPEHILVIPKKEIPTVNDIEDADAILVGKLFLTAKKIAKELAFDEKGYRLVMNCNEDGGQTVNHIHMHILAGRQLSWPPG